MTKGPSMTCRVAKRFYSGADFLSGCDGGKSPIAFYGSHATDDPTNPYSSGITILNRFVANNGCTM